MNASEKRQFPNADWATFDSYEGDALSYEGDALSYEGDALRD
jgi:hypothetical protein